MPNPADTNTNTNQNDEAVLKELEELRQFKAQKEQEAQFNELVKKVEPHYTKANGRKGHVERFVREYQSEMTETTDYDKFMQETASKDTLFFEKENKTKPAVNTSNIFKQSQPQGTNIQPQPQKENVDDFFMKSASGNYSTIRKR